MTTNGDSLGARIKAARREAGYRNVESLAVELEVSYRTLQRWEQGTSEPSIAWLRKLAALTQKPLAYFIAEVAA